MSRRVMLVVIGGALCAIAIGISSYLASSNYDRAERWHLRATKLESNADALNKLLIQRSDSLNARTRELNAMGSKVRRASRALRRSERDVSLLARRQRELANEKAQIEDERAELAAESSALTSVATAYIDCKNGLIEIIEYIVADDYASASYSWPDVSSDCDTAESELADYNASYGDR